MPDTFEAYARIPHPRDFPLDGRPERRSLDVLVNFLTERTDPAEWCWFCVWDGWGSWWDGAHSTLTAGGPLAPGAGDDPADPERDRVLRSTVRVRGRKREYFLFRGRVRSAVSLAETVHGMWPNLWWPASRTWFVSTEIYSSLTYVGGARELVGALMGVDLDAVLATVDDPLDP